MSNDPAPQTEKPTRFSTTILRLITPSMDAFGLSRGAALTAFALIVAVVVLAVFWFFKTAPPKTLTITSGAPGSSFETNAEQYRAILAKNGVTLKVLPSQGSLENLERLCDDSAHVDIGFVQGGVTNAEGKAKLVSLGSISFEPLFVFYRANSNVTLLSQLAGQRLAVGAAGSGTRALALSLLQLNGIGSNGPTQFSDLDAEDAINALIDDKVDAIFLMSDSASKEQIRRMLRTPGIQLFDFTQADGYSRSISYLNKLVLPEGSIDFGKNIPAHDVQLIGPTVELLARPNLHPALSDLLLDAAAEVHGKPGLLKHRNEFPAQLEGDYPISADAARYHKSGKGFLYTLLPFWMASIARRILVVFVPAVVVLIPALRVIPALYRLRIRLLISRWYRALLTLERNLLGAAPGESLERSMARLDTIETEVNRMKVPASFADQFYSLRQHIDYVRARLTTRT
jgi:hypothetical protein